MTTTTATELPTPAARPRASVQRRIAAWLHRHPHVRLALILALPIAWLGVAYLGSLVVLFLNAFWTTDPFTSLVVHQFTLDNFVELFTTSVYPSVTIRTVVMATLVTATCIVLAYPIAFYMAKVASPRARGTSPSPC